MNSMLLFVSKFSSRLDDKIKFCQLILLGFLLFGHLAHGAQPRGYKIQYHEQGFEGPLSYRFGFDTGDTHNPQTRHETRDGWGNVKGHYSYKDAHGKIQVVHYEADKYGFRVIPQIQWGWR